MIWKAIEDSHSGEGGLVVVKVKAHSKQSDVEQLDGIERCHYLGDHMADL